MSERFEVRGGRGGVRANYDDMEMAAIMFDDLADEMLSIAGQGHGMLVNPDLVASALLDPVAVAKFGAEMVSALDGPDGLTATAMGIKLMAVRLRAAVSGYKAADECAARLMQVKDLAQGAIALSMMPVAADRFFTGGKLGGGPGPELQRLITDHPGIVDGVVGATARFLTIVPGPVGELAEAPFRLLTGKTLFPKPVAEAAAWISVLYPDGRAKVTDLGPDTTEPFMTKPPEGFNDLMAGLNYRSNKAKGCEQGQVDVRVLDQAMPDGTVRRSYMVDIPGTQDWHLNPAENRTFLNDLGTNLHALSGDVTSYQRGVEEALRRAGATPDDPVMLVGHSQGGMVAVRAANDFVNAGSFNVTHVVTAGSPVADMPVPDSVQVLSLENAHDIVPHLDAADNPDAPNRITVTFDQQLGSVGDNHSIKFSYLGGAQELDQSKDPSVRAYEKSADAFFAGGPERHVQSQAYQITREGPLPDECRPPGAGTPPTT